MIGKYKRTGQNGKLGKIRMRKFLISNFPSAPEDQRTLKSQKIGATVKFTEILRIAPSYCNS